MKPAFLSEKRRKVFFWILLLLFHSALLFSSKIATAQSIPSFKMQLANGKLFTAKDVAHNRPVILIYFSPDCEHCQVLMNTIFKRINEFKKAQIIMATFYPLKDVVTFTKKYQTYKYPNIKVGTEIPVFFFRVYFNLENTPFTALYNKQEKLIVSYKKETPVDDLLKHLNALVH